MKGYDKERYQSHQDSIGENKRTAKWLADELGKDPATVSNMQSLLRPGITFNASDAYLLIYETFIDKMEGKRG